MTGALNFVTSELNRRSTGTLPRLLMCSLLRSTSSGFTLPENGDHHGAEARKAFFELVSRNAVLLVALRTSISETPYCEGVFGHFTFEKMSAVSHV